MDNFFSQPRRARGTAEPIHTVADAFGDIAAAADDAVWSVRLAGLFEDLEREAARATGGGLRS